MGSNIDEFIKFLQDNGVSNYKTFSRKFYNFPEFQVISFSIVCDDKNIQDVTLLCQELTNETYNDKYILPYTITPVVSKIQDVLYVVKKSKTFDDILEKMKEYHPDITADQLAKGQDDEYDLNMVDTTFSPESPDIIISSTLVTRKVPTSYIEVKINLTETSANKQLEIIKNILAYKNGC